MVTICLRIIDPIGPLEKTKIFIHKQSKPIIFVKSLQSKSDQDAIKFCSAINQWSTMEISGMCRICTGDCTLSGVPFVTIFGPSTAEEEGLETLTAAEMLAFCGHLSVSGKFLLIRIFIQ